jgi:hypothetical protein
MSEGVVEPTMKSRRRVASNKCHFCGKRMARKRKVSGKMEDWGAYWKRRYCNRECSNEGVSTVLKERWAYEKAKAELEKAGVPDEARSELPGHVRERLTDDWFDWAKRVRGEIGFDPLGFYLELWKGGFEVNSESSSGAGVIGIAPFLPRPSQDWWYWEILKHRRAATDAVYAESLGKAGQRFGRFSRLVVKARRWGFTTGHNTGLLADGTANRGCHSVATAYSREGLAVLSELSRTALGREKKAGGAKGMSHQRYETANDSVQLLLGPNESMARGWNPMHLLVSEADYIPDVDGALKSALPSVNKSPMASVVIESTMQKEATTGYKEFVSRSLLGETGYEVVFLGWMQDDTATVEPTESEVELIERITDATATSDVDKYVLKLRELSATTGQIAWWMQRLREDARGIVGDMQEMYPSTIEEALEVSLGDPWLTDDANAHHRQTLRPPKARYYMNVTETPGMKLLKEPADWQSIGHMELWRPPEAGEDYAIICDPASGRPDIIGAENFAVVGNVNTGEVCAVWHRQCSVTHFANAVAQMGHYFNDCWVVVENNKDGGMIEGLTIRLRYPKVYRMEKFNRENWHESQSIYGFSMSKETRGMAMNRLRAVWNEKRILCPSQALYDQVQVLAQRRGAVLGGSLKQKRRDDGGVCLGIFCLVRDWSAQWHSRSIDDARKYYMENEPVLDLDVRESETFGIEDKYRRFAVTQRDGDAVRDALRRLRGG